MAKEERLNARPVAHLHFEDGEGWLYLWNNGEVQILWVIRPSANRLAEDITKPEVLQITL